MVFHPANLRVIRKIGLLELIKIGSCAGPLDFGLLKAGGRQTNRLTFSEDDGNMATATVPAVHRRQPTRSILIAATVVAVLDILYAIFLYAFVVKVSTPTRVFQSIAAGVLGKAAFQGVPQ